MPRIRTIYLTDEIDDKLKDSFKRKGMSMSGLICYLLKGFFEDNEPKSLEEIRKRIKVLEIEEEAEKKKAEVQSEGNK